MRVMPFIQVLLLLALLAYLVLIALENPGLIRLPLPLGRGELLLSTGVTTGLFMVVGGLYSALLLLPTLLRTEIHRRHTIRERHATEQRLAATLQARLGSLPAERAAETPHVPALQAADK
ncbi:hypothetical protein [Deinococcus sp.]|uniref:hypothetical protein n=1 Tax=Deinococcus sp. TaxID=47478 RepID=UPI0025C2AD5C|nr:hypothetical protein [Deinococcus sp.]